MNSNIKMTKDKNIYLSPEFEIVQISLGKDILVSSGEETLSPSSVHTLPPEFTEEDPIGD